jgi:beta-lactamase regulating signal transducer with metallopeptidase domain
MTLIVTWLWQGVAIAWITAAAVRAMPRLNAATRDVIWWLALAAVLALPIAHGLATITTGTPSTPDLTPPDMNVVDAASALMLPAIPDGVMACAAALWAMTAVVGLLRIARNCRALGPLKRASSPFDRSREARLPMWAATRDNAHWGHRTAALRTSDRVTGACAIGFGSPAILVSRAVADALSDESLDEIVMHEQAHLDRYDDWSQLLLAVVCSLAGLHPAVRFLARRLDVDREAACDDRVVSCTGDARRYASALLTVAAASNPAAGRVAFAAAVPSATTTASALRVRVSRLLDPRRDRGSRLARATSLVSVTALALTVVMLTRVTPVVIFLETIGGDAPAAAVAPAIEIRHVPEPAPATNVNAAARGLERSSRRAHRRSNLEAHSDPPEVAARSSAGTTLDAALTAPLDSRVIAAVANAPVLAVPLLASQPAATASALIPAATPWEKAGDSATSAAGDIARSAVETGARARSAGVSIGRVVTRAGKAVASAF